MGSDKGSHLSLQACGLYMCINGCVHLYKHVHMHMIKVGMLPRTHKLIFKKMGLELGFVGLVWSLEQYELLWYLCRLGLLVARDKLGF